MATQQRFDAVLFDLDGVLTDSEPWWNDVRIAFARAHDRPWTHDDQHAVMGAQLGGVGGDDADAPPARPHPGRRRSRTRSSTGVVERYRTATLARHRRRPRGGPADRGDRPVAIASSSHRRVIDAAIDALGLHGVFGAVVSSDDVPSGKPEPDVYLRAADLLGVPATRCLIVEDSLNGVRAGNAAGAFVVLVPNPSVPPAGDARERANLVLDRLADLDPDALPA